MTHESNSATHLIRVADFPILENDRECVGESGDETLERVHQQEQKNVDPVTVDVRLLLRLLRHLGHVFGLDRAARGQRFSCFT